MPAKSEARPRTRLYLISPPRLEPEPFMAQLREALAGGEVAAFQLRLKEAHDGEVLRACQKLAPIAQEAGCAFILNDRPDLAEKANVDGVHIGQQDAPYAEARRLMGPDRIVGVTCHNSRHLAMVAGEAGADYVAFGAFAASHTKQPPTHAEPELLTWWQETMTTPCVAIGGITVENAEALARAGADFVAVGGGVWNHPDGPRAAVAALNAALDRAAG